MKSENSPSVVAAISMISGTTIGAGMIAQPIAGSLIGFWPTTLMLAVSGAFMAITALVLLEVVLWLKNDTHIVSMAETFLKMPGKIIAWVTYLMIGYLSLTAYIAGGGDILRASLAPHSHSKWVILLSCLAFTLFFGIFIEISSKILTKVNAIFFALLVISYILIVAIGLKDFQQENLIHQNFGKALFVVPLLFTSFSFQMIVPNIARYLEYDRARTRMAIICGTMISFLIYSVWNLVILGATPEGSVEMLREAYAKGLPPTEALSAHEKPLFGYMINGFSFFAYVTSFMGIAWGMFDFLADGLKCRKVGLNRLLLWALAIFPALILAVSYPQFFMVALEATGGYGDSILNGILPVLMLAVGVKYYQKKSSLKLLSSNIVLISLLLFALLIIGMEAGFQMNILRF